MSVVILRIDGEASPTDPVLLEEDVRQGRVEGSAEVLYPPWTGDFFQRVDAIPQLSDALDAPAARIAARIRDRRFPALTLALCLLVMGAAVGQSRIQVAAPALGHRLSQLGRVGWDAAFLDGQWWGVWTAHLLHWDAMPVLHAFANLPFLMYCGFRVERAWGPGGLARVIASAAAAGAVAVMLFSSLPVVGSSMIAFGLIGAQIAIGFRMDEAIPSGWKGIYGWGNLLAILMVFALNKGITVVLTGYSAPSSGVSHLGHVGGLLGGAGAVLIGTPAVLRPRAVASVLRDVRIAASVLAAPALLALLLPLSPTLLGAPWPAHDLPEAGISMKLPPRLAEHPVTQAGLSGWVGDPNNSEPLLVDRATFRSLTTAKELVWVDWWRHQLGQELEEVTAPTPLGPGWVAMAFEGSEWRVVEHQLQQGRTVVRVVWLRSLHDLPDYGARERLYAAIARTVQVADPPELVEERARYDRNPALPKRQHRYAHALMEAGRPAEADALLVALLARDDGWQWDAARLRLQLLEAYPAQGEGLDSSWLLPLLAEAPVVDVALYRPGIVWLAGRGECAAAAASLDRLRPMMAAWIAEHPGQSEDISVLERARAAAAEAIAGCQ